VYAVGGGVCAVGAKGVAPECVGGRWFGRIGRRRLYGIGGGWFEGVSGRRFDRGLGAYREAKTAANQHQYKQSFNQQRAGFLIKCTKFSFIASNETKSAG
jgi:hypothetical protein